MYELRRFEAESADAEAKASSRARRELKRSDSIDSDTAEAELSDVLDAEELEDLVAFEARLLDGIPVVKHHFQKEGAHPRLLFTDRPRECLMWKPFGSRSYNTLRLDGSTQVVRGAESRVLRQAARNPALCLTITGQHRSLDLELETAQEADEVYHGVLLMIKAARLLSN